MNLLFSFQTVFFFGFKTIIYHVHIILPEVLDPCCVLDLPRPWLDDWVDCMNIFWTILYLAHILFTCSSKSVLSSCWLWLWPSCSPSLTLSWWLSWFREMTLSWWVRFCFMMSKAAVRLVELISKMVCHTKWNQEIQNIS